jgi:hypothetical protein
LRETQPDEMTDAAALLDRTVADVIAADDDARPAEQGEGDSFVAVFSRARDAVTCASELQRVAPDPLRIPLRTREIKMRDEGNNIRPTINRTARLRDLATAHRYLKDAWKVHEGVAFGPLLWREQRALHEYSCKPRS